MTVCMGVLDSQLSVKKTAISQLTVEILTNSQLSANSMQTLVNEILKRNNSHESY